MAERESGGAAGEPVSLSSIVRHFETLPDPRQERNRRHLLGDILTIAVCGVIVGCSGPTLIVQWAKTNPAAASQVDRNRRKRLERLAASGSPTRNRKDVPGCSRASRRRT
jgi:hypothetical protein